jgi:hypothetical protein
MAGVKVAAQIVGLLILASSVNVAIGLGLIAWLGNLWGVVAYFGLMALLLFVLIAVKENRKRPQ